MVLSKGLDMQPFLCADQDATLVGVLEEAGGERNADGAGLAGLKQLVKLSHFLVHLDLWDGRLLATSEDRATS